ncbi:MAG: ABC transporter permease [Tissierellia bacterium]|jgi:peptide/nickel transport system permease protein|nr:ABC transporter permease [Bacillota bacterium]NLL23406.1 ABC transporter permease [Tissierellia bacterium]
MNIDKAALEAREKELKKMHRRETLHLFLSNKRALFGTALLLLFILLAIFGPMIYEYEHDGYFLGPRLGAPVPSFLLGFDEMGRDVFGALIYGARASLMIGFFVTLLIAVVGTTFGIVAGYYGGIFDIILMRITEAFMMIPTLPLMLTLAAIIGQKFSNIILILGLTGWTGTARLVRSQTFSIKERNYVERARALGASDAYIMRKHIFPNVFPLIFSNIILLVQNAIISESTLAFLGIGDPSIPTWGQLLRSAREQGAITVGSWWLFIPAGLCIVLLASSFVFIGYGFDEILNPRLRKR